VFLGLHREMGGLFARRRGVGAPLWTEVGLASGIISTTGEAVVFGAVLSGDGDGLGRKLETVKTSRR
jgi:hypothetical protein